MLPELCQGSNCMQKPRILLIEDTDSVREVLTRQLEALGMAVTALADGDLVKRELDQNPYDLVMADLHLPNCSGFDIARFAHAKKCKVVLVSGDSKVTSREDLLTAQFDQILTKPVNMDILKNMLVQHSLLKGEEIAAKKEAPADKFDESGCINITSLEEQMGELDDLALQMLKRFPTMMKPLVLDIENHVKSGDMEKLVETAHSLKGAARSAGADRLGLILERIQDAATNGQISTPEVTEMNTEFERVQNAIQKLCAA